MAGPPPLPAEHAWRPLVELALAEDLGPGDVTTRLAIAPGRSGQARIEARQALTVCGLDVARGVFAALDPGLHFEAAAADGDRAAAGDRLVTLRGRLHAILAGERTALNFLARLCGVATFTRRFVAAVEGTGVAIVDTRKTVPGWRALDKYAAAVGGARNHRSGLFDGILLKDNHLALAGGVALATKAVREAAPAQLRVQVEVESEEAALRAVEAGAELLLLDNLAPEDLQRIASRLRERVVLEASGGVTLETVRRIAQTGVHRISIGALTHSAPGADLALEIDRGGADG